MLAYVYGVVPISLCRSEGCGASGEGGRDEQANVEEEAAEAAAAAVVQLTVKDAELQAGQITEFQAGKVTALQVGDKIKLQASKITALQVK